jgi:hypothetical protein
MANKKLKQLIATGAIVGVMATSLTGCMPASFVLDLAGTVFDTDSGYEETIDYNENNYKQKGMLFMTKRFLSVILTIIMILSSVPVFAIQLESAETAAENNVETGVLQSTTFEGSGTADDPYIIADEDDFIAFSDAMAGGSKYNGKYFKQTADLDFEDSTDYNGITMSTNTMFYGIYDGDGHTINVKLSGENLCIFSYVYGTIMNLGTTGSITNTLTSGTAYAAGIARSIQANAKLINCYSTMSLKCGQVGGLSISMYGIANNCYFAGTVNGTTTSRAICVAVKTTSSFTNCYYTTDSCFGRANGCRPHRPFQTPHCINSCW